MANVPLIPSNPARVAIPIVAWDANTTLDLLVQSVMGIFVTNAMIEFVTAKDALRGIVLAV